MGEQLPSSESVRSPMISRTHNLKSPEKSDVPAKFDQAGQYNDGGHSHKTPQLFGIELKGSKQYQFAVLATGSLVTAIGFSTLQERVFRIPEFAYGGWMTIVTYATFCFCAQLERTLTGEHGRNSSLKEYALVSILMMAGLYLTNMSLNYLDYATRVIFKSSKVIPVMIFGVVVQRRRYSWQQYCAGILLVMGISSFTMGDKAIHPSFSPIGVALISLALICDALTSNLEEKLFFRKEKPCTEPEVIFYTSSMGIVGALAVATSTGELSLAVAHSMQYQETVPYIFAFSCLGYLSVSFILNLIQHYDATSTEIVKSMRKVLQVIMSFVLYSKPINSKILLGGVMVTVAIYWFQRCSKSKQKTPENAPLLPVKAGDADMTKTKMPA